MSPMCLLVSADDELLDDVLRLAAAAGARVDVAHDADAGLRGWGTASVVLLGADLAPLVAGANPPRRDQVHVIGRAPAADALFRAALAAGAETVVELPAAEGWLIETLADVVDGGVARAPTVGVVAGSGGAGATTCAAALALTAAARGPTLALDLDRFGPGLDRVVGMDDVQGIRWDALVAGSGRLGSRALRESLPRRDDLATLTWAPGDHAEPDAACVREVLAAAQRGHQLVVADLPRVIDALSSAVVPRCDRV
ncbi:MAG: septum site-determining protein Ssd, partial [Nocardioidaceae bacterium]